MDREPEPAAAGEHADQAAPPPRKPYRRPQLADLGPVEARTQSFTDGSAPIARPEQC
jgi:hypothetical protein